MALVERGSPGIKPLEADKKIYGSETEAIEQVMADYPDHKIWQQTRFGDRLRLLLRKKQGYPPETKVIWIQAHKSPK
jgi:hypothetical protein